MPYGLELITERNYEGKIGLNDNEFKLNEEVILH
jgi:hypothetical protein